jgi:hypothetical protein
MFQPLMLAIIRLYGSLSMCYTSNCGVVLGVVVGARPPPLEPPHSCLYNTSISFRTTWWWPALAAETCSCTLDNIISPPINLVVFWLLQIYYTIHCYLNTTGIPHLKIVGLTLNLLASTIVALQHLKEHWSMSVSHPTKCFSSQIYPA